MKFFIIKEIDLFGGNIEKFTYATIDKDGYE